jgi:hypothetical protein
MAFVSVVCMCSQKILVAILLTLLPAIVMAEEKNIVQEQDYVSMALYFDNDIL